MISLKVLADHLRARVSDLREVGTASDFSRSTADTIVYPSAFVVPTGESSGPPIYATCGAPLQQRVEFGFAVILYARDIHDRTGAEALQDIRVLREQILAAFGSRKFDGALDVCVPVRGRLLSGIGRDGRMAWQDDFRIPFHRTIPFQGDPS